MFKPAIYFNDYVSLAVMLLMIVALVSGQAAARGAVEELSAVSAMPAFDERSRIELSGYLGDKALKVSIDIATDLSHFRGEDE
jgi:hypothetical protein